MKSWSVWFVAFALVTSVAIATPAKRAGRADVDLGYIILTPSAYNSTGKYYTYSNIPYAAPPVGNLRWKPPQNPINVRHKGPQNGTLPTGYLPMCVQAYPDWIRAGSTGVPPSGMGQEDCLFLDVYAPKGARNLPVLVWIHGGGLTIGSKAVGSPAGLLAAGKDRGGFIFVSLNYRLGAFGFLQGADFSAVDLGYKTGPGWPNAGLYDQRFALDWVQQHIRSFGGDRNRVTVMGESAGGASIMHQIIAYGGGWDGQGVWTTGRRGFHQAILQSPAFTLTQRHAVQTDIYNGFLAATGCGNIDCLRAAPSATLINGNSITVGGAIYGQFYYNFAVDGYIVPELPGNLLLSGHFDHGVSRLMLGHNFNEAYGFTNPAINTDTLFRESLPLGLNTSNQVIIDYVADVLYPASAYPSTFARTDALISELAFTCNTFYLASAFDNATYNYLFDVPPGVHGQDVAYTFYDGVVTTGFSPMIAGYMQEYISDFVVGGNPNERGVPYFPLYSDEAKLLDLKPGQVGVITDPDKSARCRWWQKSVYA